MHECVGQIQHNQWALIKAKCPGSPESSYTINYLPYVAPTPIPFGGPYSAMTALGSTGGPLMVEEISQVCDQVLNPGKQPLTNCRSGSNLEHLRLRYGGLITLTACSNWRLSYFLGCCRSQSNTNLNLLTAYNEVQFDNLNYPNSTQAFFNDSIRPVPIVFIGKRCFYDAGAWDPEGDRLSYTLTCVKQNDSTCAPYMGNWSGSNPVPNLKLDTHSGSFSFIPTVTGTYSVALWVNEYDRCSGGLKARSLREIPFIVLTQTNQYPVSTSGLSAISGNRVQQTGVDSIRVVEGEWVTFTDTVWDPDTIDSLHLRTDLIHRFPQSKFSVQHLSRNRAVAKFELFVNPGSKENILQLHLRYTDDHCPYPGEGHSVYNLEILPGIDFQGANDTLTPCLGDSVNIMMGGATHYQWKTISGAPLVYQGAGKNIRADTLVGDTNGQVTIWVNTPTSLEISTQLNDVCGARSNTTHLDTIWIIPATAFSLSSSNDTLVCELGDSFQIQTVPSLSGFQYQYSWSPSNRLTQANSWSPWVFDDINGAFYVQVENNEGCVQRDTVMVSSLAKHQALKILAPDSAVCNGDSMWLTSNLFDTTFSGFGHPREKELLKEVTDTNTPVHTNLSSGLTKDQWPCPFSTKNNRVRQQYLYLASELSAMGLTAGDPLYGLAFRVKEAHGLKNVEDYTVKLKMVPNLNQLNSWQIQLSSVFHTTSLSIDTGWVRMEFNQHLYWDGTSDLVVDICYNAKIGSAHVPKVYLDSTQFKSSNVYADSGPFPICHQTNTVIAGTEFKRPRLKLYTRKQFPHQLYQFTWSPGSLLSSTQTAYTKAYADTAFQVKLVVQYKEGVCPDTAEINLTGVVPVQLNAGLDTILCNGDSIALSPSHSQNVLGKPNYRWSPLSHLSDPLILKPKFKVQDGPTRLALHLTDSLGCEYVDTVVIFGDPGPTADIQTLGPFCDSDSINPLQAGFSGGYFYGKAVDSITGNFNARHPDFLATGTHDLTNIYYRAVNAVGCVNDTGFSTLVYRQFDTTLVGATEFCETDSIVHLTTVNGGGQWSGAHVSGQTFSPRQAGPGTHSINIDSIGFCGASGSYQFQVHPVPGKALPDSVIGCEKTPALVNAGNPGSTYQWSNGKTQQIIYENEDTVLFLTTEDTNGCIRTDSVKVVIETICLGISSSSQNHSEITLFPNPSSSYVQIILPKTVKGTLNITLRNTEGQALPIAPSFRPNSKQEFQIDVSDLPQGIYFLHISNNTNTWLSGVFIQR